MVHADHCGDVLGRRRAGGRRARASLGRHGFVFMFTSKYAPSAALARETIALYPASEMPKSRHAATSHITMWAFRFSGPPVNRNAEPVQACGPGHQCHSTPA